MKFYPSLITILFLLSLSSVVFGQQEDLTAVEVSMDQDFLADFLHDDPVEAYNYTTGIRVGFYGEMANHRYLGLPFVREKVDSWLVDRYLDWTMYRFEKESHSFVMTINGFSPTFISDETQLFADTTAAGYNLATDLPFSSFTGFRSSRRVELSKWLAHFGRQADLAITSSFTFGFASLGLIRGVENVFGSGRPNGNLWKRDEDKPYPTGQLNYAPIPLFMYSISVESVIWRPMRQVLFQLRPEINLGYYGDIGLGLDFGKVMNTNRFVDNLSYTDTNNPGLVTVSNKNFAFSLVAGGAVRAVLYNAHYHGMFGFNKGEEYAWGDTQRYLLEGYVGLKLQFAKRVELNASINTRSSALKGPDTKYSTWGTVGLKILFGQEEEGCYD